MSRSDPYGLLTPSQIVGIGGLIGGFGTFLGTWAASGSITEGAASFPGGAIAGAASVAIAIAATESVAGEIAAAAFDFVTSAALDAKDTISTASGATMTSPNSSSAQGPQGDTGAACL